MTPPVYIARCPEHGLHGERSECFVCSGPVDQVLMVEIPAPERVRVCRSCSTLNPTTAPHGPDDCASRDWVDVPLVDHLSTTTRLVMPHPDGGWPEVWVTTSYLVHSDDPDMVETRRRLLLGQHTTDSVGACPSSSAQDASASPSAAPGPTPPSPSGSPAQTAAPTSTSATCRPDSATPETPTSGWYHEPLELALVLNWLRSRKDQRVADVDGVLSLLDRPWQLNADHLAMRDEMAAVRASEAS